MIDPEEAVGEETQKRNGDRDDGQAIGENSQGARPEPRSCTTDENHGSCGLAMGGPAPAGPAILQTCYGWALISFQRSDRLVGSSTKSSQTSLSLAPALPVSTTVLPKPVRSESVLADLLLQQEIYPRSRRDPCPERRWSCAQVSSQASAPSLGLT